MNRRTWLQAVGLSVFTGPGAIKEMLASEDTRLAKSVKPLGQRFVECQEVHNYEPFVGDVDVLPSDILKVNHTISCGTGSISQMRHWEALRSFCAVGVCVEGLVIRENQLVLASPEHVKLVFDDAPRGYDPVKWSQAQLPFGSLTRSRGRRLTEF